MKQHLFVGYRVEFANNSARYSKLVLNTTPSEAWRCLDEGSARHAELLKLWPQATNVMVTEVRPL